MLTSAPSAPERNAFFSGLSAAELAGLRSYLTPCELRVGDRLHCFGAVVEDVVFPHSGLVAMTKPLRHNSGAAAALIGRDGMVGGIAAAADMPATADAEVQIAGLASRLSAVEFRHIIEQNPGVRRRVARFANVLLAHAQQTALCHANHPVESRICRWLLEIRDRTGGNDVPLTQSTLAQMLGVRRTTVTLVAGRLEAAGVLHCRRGSLQIIDQEELERHSCECYAQMTSTMSLLEVPRDATALLAPKPDRTGRRAT
jgi:CRP-like cAMP-binding protein